MGDQEGGRAKTARKMLHKEMCGRRREMGECFRSEECECGCRRFKGF